MADNNFPVLIPPLQSPEYTPLFINTYINFRLLH